jgi:hypothetical protein
MSIVNFSLNFDTKEIVVTGPVPPGLLPDFQPFIKKVCGKNAIIDGKRAQELGAVMVFRSGDK